MECALAGFTEILTLSLCSRKENFESLNHKDDGSAVEIANPKVYFNYPFTYFIILLFYISLEKWKRRVIARQPDGKAKKGVFPFFFFLFEEEYRTGFRLRSDPFSKYFIFYFMIVIIYFVICLLF